MKRIFNITLTALMAAFALVSCKKESLIYDGPVLVHFNSQGGALVVENPDDEFAYEIKVGLTKPADRDITINLEIDTTNSTAIEGLHFTLSSNQVVIPAGQTVASVKAVGIYENLEEDALTASVRIAESEYSAIYGQEIKIRFRAPCDGILRIEKFVGTYELDYPWFQEDDGPYTVTAVLDPERENTIIFKDLLDDGFDVAFTLDSESDDILVEDSDAWIYDPGFPPVVIADVNGTYEVCEQIIEFYAFHHIPGVGSFPGSDNQKATLTKLKD